MIHLSEQVKLAELEQLLVKSHGQHTYLEERMQSTQHAFYANASLSSQVLYQIHYIFMYIGEFMAKL